MTRINTISPYAKLTLGDRVFAWGDGYLKSVAVTLGEGENSNNCDATLYDPGRKLIDALLTYIEEIEGLEPLNKPEPRKTTTGAGAGSGTADGSLSANMRAALDLIGLAESGPNGGYNTAFGGGTLPSLANHPSPGSLTPAGRYQIQGRTWNEFKGDAPDFGPKSQDAVCVRLIERRGARAAIEAGDIAAALAGTGGVTGLAWEWAALPYAP